MVMAELVGVRLVDRTVQFFWSKFVASKSWKFKPGTVDQVKSTDLDECEYLGALRTNAWEAVEYNQSNCVAVSAFVNTATSSITPLKNWNVPGTGSPPIQKPSPVASGAAVAPVESAASRPST